MPQFPHPLLVTALALGSLTAAPLCAQQLTKEWECAPVMDKPESAVYDPETERLFISNINGEYFALDGNGFIATLDPSDGSVIEEKWFANGLNNPQGLALYGHSLYVADLTRIVSIDTTTGALNKVIPVDGAKFINDLSADSNGDLYASDSTRNCIYRLHESVVEIWLQVPEFDSVNGVLCLPDCLLFVNFNNGKLYSVDKATKELSLVCEGIANGDGIASDGAGGFFVSGAWQGEVFHIDANGNKKLVLNLGPEHKITADIQYLPEQKRLIIPTLDKTVLAYHWE